MTTECSSSQTEQLHNTHNLSYEGVKLYDIDDSKLYPNFVSCDDWIGKIPCTAVSACRIEDQSK